MGSNLSIYAASNISVLNLKINNQPMHPNSEVLHRRLPMSTRPFQNYSVFTSSISPMDRVKTFLISTNYYSLNQTESNSNFTTNTNEDLSMFEYYHLSQVPHTLPTIIFLSCFVILVIACTLIGNTLVCLAVALVRKLRKQAANYLLVSLAVSDLCVSIMVMPLAFLYLILGRWPFGQFLCDVWTSADVTLCTASILNLCVISVDRYMAIVHPLIYCPKRTGKRMMIYIIIVWILAFLISVLPPIAFWTPSPPEQCIVSQIAAYQIYATMGSFYIPAVIIMVVNYKIYKAARRLTRADQRAAAFTGSATSSAVAASGIFVGATPIIQANSNPVRKRSSIRNPRRQRGCDYDTPSAVHHNGHRSDGELTPLSNHETHATNHATATAASNGGFLRLGRAWRERLKPIRQSIAERIRELFTRRSSGQRLSLVKNHNGRFYLREFQTRLSLTPYPHRRRSDWGSRCSRNAHQMRLTPNQLNHHSRYSDYQRPYRHERTTETKAMKTLGLIMGCFVACWLPFFTVTLVKALCPENYCSIPGWLDSVVLWLGYANSTLNPILYAKYNKDFRIPFREMLCCRFSTMKLVLRQEEYRDTFGSHRTSLDGIVTHNNSVIANHSLHPIGSISSTNSASRIQPVANGVAKSISTPVTLSDQQEGQLDGVVLSHSVEVL